MSLSHIRKGAADKDREEIGSGWLGGAPALVAPHYAQIMPWLTDGNRPEPTLIIFNVILIFLMIIIMPKLYPD